MTEECAETVEECQSGTKGCVNGKLNFPNGITVYFNVNVKICIYNTYANR